MGAAIRILGIDPGLVRTGWGAIECTGATTRFIAAGTIVPDPSAAMALRLCRLFEGLAEVITALSPDEAAVENTFVNMNARTTLALGQARGVALLVPARSGLLVAEYAPNLVKKTVVGSGHGAKQQIRMMVRVLLPRAQFDSDDAADALAVALTHAHHRSRRLADAIEAAL